MTQTVESKEVLKRAITSVLILFVVVVVYFSGPSTAFLTSGYPTMAHNAGSKDINVSITFYKERYEAIGTIEAKLFKLPPNPTAADITAFSTTPWVYETVGANDYNCWATPYAAPATGQNNTSFYSYELDAYYAPNTPIGATANDYWTSGIQMDSNFDIFAYGYMWNPWVNMRTAETIAQNDTNNPGNNPLRMPGDANFAYLFIDYTEDLRALGSLGAYDPYNPTWGETLAEYRAGTAAIFGYYGYGYNYAGKFTCVFHFRSVPEGIYLGIVPKINGIKVGATGWDSGGQGVTPEGQKSGSIVMIKDVNTTNDTDLNFVEPSGTKRISFTVPRTAIAATGATFITIDVNADNASAPTGANLNLGNAAVSPPRFSIGANGNNSVLSSPATLKMYWTGFITRAQAEAIGMTKLKMYQYDPVSAHWEKLSTTVDLDNNVMSTSITNFV